MTPAEQISKCLTRSMDVAKELNAERYKYYLETVATSQELRERGDVQSANAILELSSEGYRIWERARDEAPNYSSRPCVTKPGCIEVYRSDNQVAPPRIIGPDEPCICSDKIANMSLCKHELVEDGGLFKIERFRPRFRKRKEVKSALRPATSAGHFEHAKVDAKVDDEGSLDEDPLEDSYVARADLSQMKQGTFIPGLEELHGEDAPVFEEGVS